MLTTAVTYGTPVERLEQRPATFREELRRARNADEALFAAAAACAEVTAERTQVFWPTRTAAGEWLRRLQGQRSGPKNGVILGSLRRLDLADCVLDGLDLYATDLSASVMPRHVRGAWLELANLAGVDLSGRTLSGANLSGTNLSGANLSGADLTGADLTNANLRHAMLADVSLENAVLTNAQFDRGEPKKSARRV